MFYVTLISLYEFFSQQIVILTVRSERATERKFQGAKWPGSERARKRVGQGANRPESYWPIHSGERNGPGTKRHGTHKRYPSM